MESDKKKRLWIISELFPPEETSTAHIMGEIAQIFKTKYNVGVICGSSVYDKTRKQVANNDSNLDFPIYRTSERNFDKNSIMGKGTSFISTTYSLYKLAKSLIKEGDKVLMVTNPAPLILLMARLRRKRDFELNVLVHDIFPENTKAAGLKIPFFIHLKFLFDKAYSRADKLIVLGRDMADIVRCKTSDKVQIEIIENWGDFENISPQKLPDSQRIILQYAGNIGRVQGLEEILKALPDNIDFHIYGSGALEQKLKEYGKPNVKFFGPYSRSAQEKILGACHISLVTLNDKMYGLGTPSKTYNILAAGRPILYFGPNNSEIELLIKENNIGFTSWPIEWNIETMKQMGERARQIGENNYSKQVILEKFLSTI